LRAGKPPFDVDLPHFQAGFFTSLFSILYGEKYCKRFFDFFERIFLSFRGRNPTVATASRRAPCTRLLAFQESRKNNREALLFRNRSKIKCAVSAAILCPGEAPGSANTRSIQGFRQRSRGAKGQAQCAGYF
jgi:hypothetical protein